MTPQQIERQEGIEKAAVSLAEVLKPRTSLYDIATEIAELMEMRETAENDEQHEAINNALEAYREKLPQKVDDVRGYIKHCEMMAECARQESAEQAARAKLWGNRAQRTKDYALEVMQAFGAKKLSGRTGDLRMQANPPSVEITREDILPNELKRVTITFGAGVWFDFVAFIDRHWSVVDALAKPFADKWRTLGVIKPEVAPDKAAIAAALKQPCFCCAGDRILTDLRDGVEISEKCPECNGTGKATVPGARLVTDKAHLRL